MVNVKVKIQNNNFDLIKTFLKVLTYGIAGTVSTAVVQLTQGGMNFKEAMIYGAAIGVIAGMKNISKHYFNVDIDLTRLKK